MLLRRLLPLSACSSFVRIVGLLLAGTACAATSAAQATFTVTTLTDPASGVAANCTNQTSGASLDSNCSLRDALAAAAAVNGASGTTPVTVNFVSSLAAIGNPGIITLGANSLPLPTYTTVQGLTFGSGYGLTNLITIKANSHVAFSVAATVASTSLNNFTITNGAPAVVNSGILAISQCTFSGNSYGSGGAIYSEGTLTVRNSTFTGNSTSSYGGAIYSTGPELVTTLASTISLTVTGSTFQGNTSAHDGGAIYVGRYSVGAIDSSTFTGNSATRDGAAIFISNGSGLTSVTNSILSGDTGNSECDGVGCSGALKTFTFAGSEPPGVIERGYITLALTLSTGRIITVSAPYGEGSNGAGLASYFGATITGSYYPTLSAQGFGPYLMMAPQSGTITSVQIINPSTYFTVTPVSDTAAIGAGNTIAPGASSANLSTLGNYGGPTQTVLPLPGSVALCTITPTSATGIDQRGLPRTTTFGTSLCQDSGSVQTNYGLSFAQQPVTAFANVAIAPAPSVQMTESGQNLAQANGLVTASIQSGTLSGQTSAKTDSTGVATFSNLQVTSLQTADTLTASLTIGANKVSTTSNAFDVNQQPTATLTGVPNFPLTALFGTATQLFTFTNTGTSSITITALSTNYAPTYMQTNTCGLTLAAGASCTITVTFNPRGIGTQNGLLNVISNAGGYSPVIYLSGTSAIATAALTGSGAFPDTAIGVTSASQTITLRNTSASIPLTINSVTATGDFAQTNQCGTSLAMGASCTISVNFTPTANGSRTGSLSVSTNASITVPAITLSGTGSPVVATLTGSGSFASTNVGSTSASQTYTLSNTGTTALSISAIAVTGDFTQTNQCGASLAAGATCAIAVTFSPVAGGARTGLLTVSSNATTPIPTIALSGTGLTFAGALTGSGSFPSTAVGSSSTAQTLTLTNSGTGPLTISAITATGDFSQTNQCGASLAANTTCSIVVTFMPTAMGTRTGALTVSTNATTAIPAVILSGTGTVIQGTLTGGADFGSIPLTTSSQAQSYVLSNTGNDTLTITGIATTGDFSKTTSCGTTLAAGATCSITVTFMPTALGARTGTLAVTSNAKTAIAPTALTGTGIAAPSFSLGDGTSGTSSTPISVTAGTTGTGTLKFTSTNGFSGSIALTCAAQGTAPTGASCTITSPITLTSAGTATATVTITTTARTMASGLVALSRRGLPMYPALLALLFASLLAIRSAGRAARVGSLLAFLLVLGMGLTGCGGGSGGSGTTTNPNGTPAGTYTYVVTATSGGVTATQTISVTVQ